MSLTRRHLTVGIIGTAVLFASAGAYFSWQRSRVSAAPSALIKRLPTVDAAVVGINFDALRQSGLLRVVTGAKSAVEPEYLGFVRDTGFDYARDLDYVLASFTQDSSFFLVKGSFDWDKLERYAAQHGGRCVDHFCRMEGSTAERKISFLPLRGEVMAMAVSPDEGAALRLTKPGPQQDLEARSEPVWISLSSGALRRAGGLPAGTTLFASVIADADRITLTLGPKDSGIEAHLEALCRDPQQAGALTGQLRMLTTLLKNAAKLKAPSDGFGGTLASGTFDQADRTVLGRWQIERGLLESLTAGI